jgi:hypothetical protein
MGTASFFQVSVYLAILHGFLQLQPPKANKDLGSIRDLQAELQ